RASHSPLSLHDALPIYLPHARPVPASARGAVDPRALPAAGTAAGRGEERRAARTPARGPAGRRPARTSGPRRPAARGVPVRGARSEEHTSELQSRENLV